MERRHGVDRVRNWRLKAKAQLLMSAMPGGHYLNYAMQRAIGGLPLPESAFAASIGVAHRHVDSLRRFVTDPESACTFEFGAGFDLHMPLIQHALGIRQQRLVDIRPLVRTNLVRGIARRLTSNGEAGPWISSASSSGDLNTLLAERNITYKAPSDARSTGYAASSIDAVFTTNTLEHIPPADLLDIYVECRRLLKPGGIVSMAVDYSDHWSHFDRTLTPYNFLRFESDEWNRWNPTLMHQNRLRHSDHLGLAEAAGFEPIETSVIGNDDEGLRMLAKVPLSSEFADRDPTDVAITSAHFLLRAA